MDEQFRQEFERAVQQAAHLVIDLPIVAENLLEDVYKHHGDEIGQSFEQDYYRPLLEWVEIHFASSQDLLEQGDFSGSLRAFRDTVFAALDLFIAMKRGVENLTDIEVEIAKLIGGPNKN